MSKIGNYLKEKKWLAKDQPSGVTRYTNTIILSKWDSVRIEVLESQRSNDLSIRKTYYFINEDDGSVEYVTRTKTIENSLSKLIENIGDQ